MRLHRRLWKRKMTKIYATISPLEMDIWGRNYGKRKEAWLLRLLLDIQQEFTKMPQIDKIP